MDSGASSHMTPDREIFTEYEEKLADIGLAGKGKDIEAHGIGNVKIKQNERNIELTKVLYVPNLKTCLMSVPKIVDNGFVVTFSNEKAEIKTKDNDLVATATRKGDRFEIEEEMNMDIKDTIEAANETTQSTKLWHQRLGHLNYTTLEEMSRKNLVNGLNDLNTKEEKSEPCQSCISGKMKTPSHVSLKGRQSTQILELLHVDLMGPVSPLSKGKARYVLTIVDDYSRKIFTRAIKSKSDVKEELIEFISLQEKQTGKLVKRIRSDNAGEFIDGELQIFLRKQGIKHELTTAYSPQSNGTAERANRTIMEMTRTLLLESELPKDFWAECLYTATYLICKATLHGRTPQEIWSHHIPSVNHLRKFGCVAHVLIPNFKRTKLEPKSKKGIFVGYSTKRKGYRIYMPETDKIIEDRNVVFVENELGSTLLKHTSEEKPESNKETATLDLEMIGDKSKTPLEENGKYQEIEASPNERPGRPRGTTSEVLKVRHQLQMEENEQELQRRGVRRSERIQEQKHQAMESIVIPQSYDEAMKTPEKNKWVEAMTEELESIKKHNVWETVDLPKDEKTVKSKWIYNLKENLDGSVKKFKARLVAVGYSQRPGHDYGETFAPVLRMETLRTLLNVAGKLGLKIEQHDVKTAYLHAELQDKIYMEPPIGDSKLKQGKVYFLKKSLYGLKQSGRCWNEKLHKELTEIGFIQSKCDPCLYFIREGKNYVYLGAYVDDIVTLGSTDEYKTQILSKIEDKIELINIGELTCMLGMQVDQRKGKIIVHQEKYIRKILKKYGMEQCNPANTPMDVTQKLNEYEESPKVDQKYYQELVGSLMYLATGTRPDLCYALSALSQFNADPRKMHLNAVKRVFRYLKGTSDYALTYCKEPSNLHSHADASWDKTTDSKSFSGFIIKDGTSLLNWKCNKQGNVALSTAESELNAITEAVKELIWSKLLMKELQMNIPDQEPTILFNDNQAAVQMVQPGNQKMRTKLLNRKGQFVKEELKNSNIQVVHIAGENMQADFLTKALSAPKLEESLMHLGFDNIKISKGI